MDSIIELFAVEGEDCSPKLLKAFVKEKPKLAKRLHEIARELFLLYGPSLEEEKTYRKYKGFFHELAKKKGDKKTLILKGLRKARAEALCWMCRKCLEKRSSQSEKSSPPTELTEKKKRRKKKEENEESDS